MDFDLKIINPEDVSGGMTEQERIEAAKKLPDFPFSRVRGMEKLVLYFKKFLLTSYGSDPQRPNYGSYLKRMMGQSYDDLEDVADDIQREVERVVSQIKTIQEEATYEIPPSERLRDIRLLSIYEEKSDFWSVNGKYLIINYEGEEYEGELFSDEG